MQVPTFTEPDALEVGRTHRALWPGHDLAMVVCADCGGLMGLLCSDCREPLAYVEHDCP